MIYSKSFFKIFLQNFQGCSPEMWFGYVRREKAPTSTNLRKVKTNDIVKSYSSRESFVIRLG